VDYIYKIATKEVNLIQYTEFLNAVDPNGLRPVTYVSWNDAARFTNWLQNGQGSGSTESGVYNMSLTTPTRSGTATVFIASENEWYKAAYYDQGGSVYELNDTVIAGSSRGLRGGSWANFSNDLLSSSRIAGSPWTRASVWVFALPASPSHRQRC
jgi:formylglycine-generating enzyme required for sulfatase activity